MIKLFISDLDGTLFHGHGDSVFDITPANKEAIIQARTKGISFGIATGRGHFQGIEMCEIVGAKPLVGAMNGSCIYAEDTLQQVYKISCENIIRTVDYLVDHCFHYIHNVIVSDEQNCSYHLFPNYHRDTRKHTEERQDLYTHFDHSAHDACKISIVCRSEHAQKIIRKKLEFFLHDVYEITNTDPDYLEITPKDVSKGLFLAWVMKRYKLKKHEIAVIGDSNNDVKMIEAVTHSFAMQNGTESVKQRAAYIVNSVAEALHYCIRMNEE